MLITDGLSVIAGMGYTYYHCSERVSIFSTA